MNYRVHNKTRGTVIADRVSLASTLRERMVGLLGTAELRSGEGLWIDHCNSIHTFFMKFAIDALFLDAESRVVRAYRNLVPFRATRLVWKAKSVLELPAGSLENQAVELGDRVLLERAP